MFGKPRSEQIEFDVANESSEEVAYHLGEKEFKLEPRYTRTHILCSVAKLRVHLGRDKTRRFTPSGGERFVVAGSGEGLSVEKR
jgi:hypothetical protein